MLTFIILGGALGLLFLLAFVMKRRFGVLGLALAAGSLLSAYWTDAVGAFLEGQGVELVAPPLASVVAISLALLPALLLVFSGPAYHNKMQRIIGSLLFAAMAFLVVLPALTSIFVVEASAESTVQLLTQYRTSILAALIAYAVLDTMLAQGGSKSHGKKAGH